MIAIIVVRFFAAESLTFIKKQLKAEKENMG
jgi:hypothetical protein